MNLKNFYIVILLVLFFQNILFANNEQNETNEQSVLQTLNWIEGPQVVQVGEKASFKIPDGYVFLYPKDTAKIMEFFHNPPSYRDEYYFGPKNLTWFGIFSYEDTGHISDDESIDADELIQAIKQGTEQSNEFRTEKGWEPMYIIGWRYKPFYDNETKRLSWAIEAQSGTEQIINYNTRILGRTGVTSAILVSGINELDQTVDMFNQVVNGYTFNDDQKYSSFVEGDKVAQYGLAALIAGGAAAVTTKKGFWATLIIAIKVFWKFILAGIVAVFAFFRKFFK